MGDVWYDLETLMVVVLVFEVQLMRGVTWRDNCDCWWGVRAVAVQEDN